MSQFRFSVGPWNVSDGTDVYGPATREPVEFEEKLRTFAKMGFEGIQFHDDDVVEDISSKTEEEILARAEEVKALIDEIGMEAEFVAPRLWFEREFKDGAYTAPIKEDWEHAMWRSYRSIDIANVLGAKFIVLWLAREGTLCMESKEPVEMINQLIESLNLMLDYDPDIRIAIEPKPNEPIDRSYVGSAGHALAIASRTNDPDRVGVLIEPAHSTMAGFEGTYDMALGLAFGKLYSVHLNDQNGVRYDQDKIFGAENLRSAFNQVKLLVDHNYGAEGQFIGLDAKAMRASGDEYMYQHLENSVEMVKMLEKKVKNWDQEYADKLAAEGNYEGLEMYTLRMLLEG